jgi:GcrA cell cycle regulator
MTTWTDARVIELKARWINGLSAAQIANDLGGDITRSSVIGKIHRLGLSGRVKTPTTGRPRTRATRETMQVRRLKGTAKSEHPRFEVETIELVAVSARDNAIPFAQRCSFVQLTDATCHWPVGDVGAADFFFCGGIVGVVPYCPHHTRVAVRPCSPQRRRAA